MFKKFIKDVPNYPQLGVIFKDITPLLSEPEIYEQLINQLVAPYENYDNIIFASIEARGNWFTPAMALKLHKPWFPVRKKGKLPRECYSASYITEYSIDTLEMHKDAIQPGQKVVIVDDVVATGGTIRAVKEIVERAGGEVIAVSCIIFLPDLYTPSGILSINSILTF
jgi:adenine phosphoribosyltransferase